MARRFYKRDVIGRFARVHALRAGKGAKKLRDTARSSRRVANTANRQGANRIQEVRSLVGDVRRLNREIRGIDRIGSTGGVRARTFKRRPGTIEARAQLTGPVVLSSSRTTRSRISGREVTKTRSVTLNPGERLPNQVVLSRQPRKRRERRSRVQSL